MHRLAVAADTVTHHIAFIFEGLISKLLSNSCFSFSFSRKSTIARLGCTIVERINSRNLTFPKFSVPENCKTLRPIKGTRFVRLYFKTIWYRSFYLPHFHPLHPIRVFLEHCTTFIRCPSLRHLSSLDFILPCSLLHTPH